jgi:hypothetical protein
MSCGRAEMGKEQPESSAIWTGVQPIEEGTMPGLVSVVVVAQEPTKEAAPSMSCVLDREASTREGGRLPAGTTSVVKACDSDMWLLVGGDPERSGASPVSRQILQLNDFKNRGDLLT